MITPVQLFSPDPGHITDFSKIPVADIFNNALQARSAAFSNPSFEAPDLANSYQQEIEQDQYAPQPTGGSDYSPATLFSSSPSSELFSSSSDAPTPASPTRPDPASVTNFSAPIDSEPMNNSFDPADFVFESEARRDAQGNLRVYTPPSGDGGGAYEVAGITERYQPEEARQLRNLIRQGRASEAEQMAKDFYRKRAEPYTQFTTNRGLQLQLTDTVHHRGEGGLVKILQRATGSDARSPEKLIAALSAQDDALAAFDAARRNYEWDEVDRGRASRQKFRRGLENRFNQANEAAKKLI